MSMFYSDHHCITYSISVHLSADRILGATEKGLFIVKWTFLVYSGLLLQRTLLLNGALLVHIAVLGQGSLLEYSVHILSAKCL